MHDADVSLFCLFALRRRHTIQAQRPLPLQQEVHRRSSSSCGTLPARTAAWPCRRLTHDHNCSQPISERGSVCAMQSQVKSKSRTSAFVLQPSTSGRRPPASGLRSWLPASGLGNLTRRGRAISMTGKKSRSLESTGWQTTIRENTNWSANLLEADNLGQHHHPFDVWMSAFEDEWQLSSLTEQAKHWRQQIWQLRRSKGQEACPL